MEELSALVPAWTNIVATTTGEDSWKRETGCVRISLPRICRKSYPLVRSAIPRDFLVVRINDVEITRAIISRVCLRASATERESRACVSNGETRDKCLGSFRELGNIFQAFDCTVYVCIYVFAIVTYECLG